MSAAEDLEEEIRVTEAQRAAAREVSQARYAEYLAAQSREGDLARRLVGLKHERALAVRGEARQMARFLIYTSDGHGRLFYRARDYRDAIAQAAEDGHPLAKLTAMSSDADSPGVYRPVDHLLAEAKREAERGGDADVREEEDAQGAGETGAGERPPG